MAVTIVSNKDGRLTIPAEARAALRVEGETHWTLEIADGALILRPAVVVQREDAWAYTPTFTAKIARAREDARLGRVVTLSGEELAAISDLPDDEMAAHIEHLRRNAAQGGSHA